MAEYDLLFQSLRVGNLTLPNRVVMTTVKLGYSNLEGEITERHIAFYARPGG
jgi:2,4-dienoyl-CoA reductase-like NADH-dependent reductase (Old Yellow Enzyme family)